MFEKREKGSFMKLLIASFLTSLLVGVAMFLIAANFIMKNVGTQQPQSPGVSGTPKPQQISAELKPGATPAASGTQGAPASAVSAVASVARTAVPGVVGISVLKADERMMFSSHGEEKWGVGSGVIISSKGYILTNNHVAGGNTEKVVVSLIDGRNVDGVTVWSDPVIDLAIVKIAADQLTVIPLGDADKLQVGETAVAIGNPLGLQLQRSVTSGIISALNRTIKIESNGVTNFMEDLIQTDASINPGNSGGPLLNSEGQVVGINTIKVEGAEAIGFAIPVNIVTPIIKKLEQTGGFKEPYLGLFAYDKEAIPFIDSNIKADNGIYVANIDNNGPAAKSGLKIGCIITQVDGVKVDTMMQLRCLVYGKNPGDTVKITHLSGGKAMDVNCILHEKTKEGSIER